MKTFLALCYALVFCASAHADPKLVGRWRSDRELTMADVRSHSKMEERTILFIEQMVGRATLTIDSRSIKTDMPAFQSRTVEGVVSELAAVVETHPYSCSARRQLKLP